MINIQELNPKEFETKKRRMKTLCGMSIIDITAIFYVGEENRTKGGCTASFAYDNSDETNTILYKIGYKEEEITLKWGKKKTKLHYVADREREIKDIEDLKKMFRNGSSHLTFEFDKE